MSHFLHALMVAITPFLLPITVEATGYTCEPHALNPMNAPGMCIALANGSREVMSPGMACPPEWMGMVFYVPTQGTLRCDDTGAYDFLLTTKGAYRPHTDFRFTTFDAAWTWGRRPAVIYLIRPRHLEVSRASAASPACALCRARLGHGLHRHPHTLSGMNPILN